MVGSDDDGLQQRQSPRPKLLLKPPEAAGCSQSTMARSAFAVTDTLSTTPLTEPVVPSAAGGTSGRPFP